MGTLRNIAILVLLTVLFSVESANSQECSSLSEDLISTHRALYEYAQFAESAYGQTESNSCFLEVSGQRIGSPPHRTLTLLPQDFDERWEPQILERWPDGSISQPESMSRYIGDDGVTYVTCDYDGSIGPHLALTWTEFWRTQENGEPLSFVDVIVEVVIVAARWILPSREELGLVRLRRDSLSESGAEELVAIRGTDFTRVPQIMASIGDLLSESCVFEVAAIVVDYIGDNLSDGRISVVGHSLGGAAAQYIVKDHVQHPWRNPANRQTSTVTFGAYSFNAVGLDHRHVGNADPSTLLSYVISGELVSSWLSQQLGRRQAGSVIRYVPPDSWPSVGEFEVLENALLRGEVPEAIRRHRLPAVQQGLCECMNGHGSIVLNHP